MATWFKRPAATFSISAFMLPLCMVKSSPLLVAGNRRLIVQLKNIRSTTMFSLTTSFNRDDFIRLLTTGSKLPGAATVL